MWRMFNATAAELVKLRTLPSLGLVALVTAVGGVGIALALASSAAHSIGPRSGSAIADVDPVSEAVLGAVPFMQLGMLLLGILPVSHEHDGHQQSTSLRAVPHRGLYAAAKSLAATLMLLAAATVTVVASVVAVTALHEFGGGTGGDIAPEHIAMSNVSAFPPPLIGAVLYLALIGLLAHAVTLLLRRLIPSLAALLIVVLILPPLLSATEHSRWLPSRVGTLLYLPNDDPALSALTGFAVLAAWILGVGVLGFTRLQLRDA